MEERINYLMSILTGDEEYAKELEYFSVKVLLCSSMQRISRVGKFKDSMDLAKETLRFIRENFGGFKKNPYCKGGITNLYMKTFNGFTAGIYMAGFRFLNKFKRVYS